MNLVKINGVSKSYGDHQALDNIAFGIPENSVFGLLGPNGAGKTTLIRIITQIIMPDSGQVLFKEVPMLAEDVRKIGYLPEERGLYKKMKVSDQLIFLARLKGMSRPDAVASIKHWMEKLDIMAWHNKNVEDLSKGMQQKIQFIATVVHKPSLIILDEPFSGFDPVNANLIKDEILELKENGATIIFSTHRMESVEELCDQITLIHHSKILIHGAKKDIKNQYRNNTFIAEYQGDIPISDNGFDVLKTKSLEDGIVRSEVKIADNHSVNDLVDFITSKTKIVSINEKIPSINDIFISTVKPTSHE
ncbi:ABC-2 type transport system ATP-binding protein [Reichenbachiella faecimaris]|uniref:ABC-2 type transport system ATP-binding protein n=1 Tax=Reichenbachiella faecimaris TaxID=692418 RepID=A0A1W2GF20_REIFA|nr:ATP-binding cassette domain-containing protein [Reichenbachiella faecimaris]SMD35191.1 ABC-2 type transport system ATP-binding protein [Reichenbachiella faecimaris]